MIPKTDRKPHKRKLDRIKTEIHKIVYKDQIQ